MKSKILPILLLAITGFAAWSYSWTYTDEGRLDYRAALSLHLFSFDRKIKPRPETDFELEMPVNLAFALTMILPHDEVLRVEDRTIDGPASDIPVRIYWPESTTENGAAPPGPLPVMVYYHGGGFVVGSVDIFDPLARSLAQHTQAIVISVDYRLAPEHPYPAAVDDAYAALLWAAEHATELGGDPQQLIVAGDSAGGNLAAVMALKARDQGGPELAYQVLYYPAVDLAGSYPSTEKFGEDYGLPTKTTAVFRQAYISDNTNPVDPYLSPIKAASLEQLPPALIVTAGFDPLADSGKAYAEKLQAAGVPVTLLHYPGMIHGFMSIVAFSQQKNALEKTGKVLAQRGSSR